MRMSLAVKLTRPKPEELSGREVESYSPDGFAVVHIVEFKPGQFRYVVEDPPVTKAQLEAVKKIVEEELVYVARPSDVASWEALERLLKRAGVRDEKIIYLIGREVVGYKALHPLMMDEKLEDILGIGPNLPVVVLHKDYGRIPTNLVFSEREMDELVRTLAYRGGKTISRFMAKLDSVILPTGDRCRLVYRSEISPSSNFTIRKFPRHPWTPTRILATGMISPVAMAWLWLAIEYKLPVLTYGMMGSGKTSLNNALAMLIRPDSSLALISDVPEMKVPHPIKYEFYARQPETLGGTGAITLEDLVAHALRASVEYVIINEVRFAEARAFVHAIGIGHGGLCLPYDQLVPMVVDDEVGIFKIGEVVERALKGEVKEILVLSWDGTKASWVPVKCVVKKRGSKKFYRFKLEGGVEFEVHEGHPVIVYEGGRLVKKPAKEVKVGEWVPVLKEIPTLTPTLNFLDVIEVLKGKYADKLYVEGASDLLRELGCKRLHELIPEASPSNIADWKNRDCAMPLTAYLKVEPRTSYRRRLRIKYGEKGRRSLPVLLKLSRELGYIIGLFLADGSIQCDEKDGLPSKVHFYVENERVSRVVSTLRKIGLEAEAIGIGKTKSRKAKCVTVYNKVFALLMYEILKGKVTDYDREVPLNLALRAPREFREGILEGYWDGDGSLVRAGKNALRPLAETVNPRLAHTVALLAKTLGVHISVKVRPNNSSWGGPNSKVYVLLVCGCNSLRNFLKALNKMDVNVSIAAKGKIRDLGNLLLCRVLSIEEREETSWLYDFEVLPHHNFAVSGSCAITSNTTLHAGSLTELFGRLKDLQVERSIAGELRLLVNTTVFVAVREGKPTRLRRVKAIYFLDSLTEGWEPETTTLYEYDPARDELIGKGVEDSRLLELLQMRSLKDKSELMEEHRVRAKFLSDAAKAFIKTGRYGEADEWFTLLKEFYAAREEAVKRVEELSEGAELKKIPYEIVGEEEAVRRLRIAGDIEKIINLK